MLVPSGKMWGEKDLGLGLNTFPSTAGSHGKDPLPKGLKEAQGGAAAGGTDPAMWPSLPPSPQFYRHRGAALTLPGSMVSRTPGRYSALQPLCGEPGARSGRHPPRGSLWTVLLTSSHREMAYQGHLGNIRPHQGRQAGGSRDWAVIVPLRPQASFAAGGDSW